MRNKIFNITGKLEKVVNRKVLKESHDIKALKLLAPYMSEYLPWTGSALRPSAACILLNEIIIHNKLRVLEIGCGMSTIMLSQILAERGGSMVSIDNDSGWIEVTKNNLKGGVEVCDFIHTDLKELEISGSKYNWYDLSEESIARKLGGARIDLLLVDAPIAAICKNSRYPALPMLKQYLADDFVVFLDDIERDDETAIAAQWCEEFDLSYQKSGIMGGLGIMRPRNTLSKFNIC